MDNIIGLFDLMNKAQEKTETIAKKIDTLQKQLKSDPVGVISQLTEKTETGKQWQAEPKRNK